MTSSRPFPERSNKRDQPDLIIIGGGASGLAAACILSQRKLPFLLLEKEARPGRKLLATGNGRCNLMNLGEPVFFGDSGFANAVLSRCGSAETGRFFNSIGLAFFEEELGRAYPNSRQAASVLDCLLACIESAGVGKIITGARAEIIKRAGQGWRVQAGGQTHEAPCLVIATGGPAAPRLGGDAGLLQELVRLGHSLRPFFPALCALNTGNKPLKGLAGQRAYACLALEQGGRPVCAAAGELLFTEEGLSGLCAMQLARDAREGLDRGLKVEVLVDFSPLLGIAPATMGRLNPAEVSTPARKAAALALLKERAGRLGPERVYTGLLPRAMGARLENLTMEQAADWLTSLRLQVTGTRGFDHAQVAAGGLDCGQFDPHTLRSLLHPGLYACGEALNVDGDTGGYNLLFAWASGILAARDIARG